MDHTTTCSQLARFIHSADPPCQWYPQVSRDQTHSKILQFNLIVGGQKHSPPKPDFTCNSGSSTDYIWAQYTVGCAKI